MSNYRPPSKSDWILAIVFIFCAYFLNLVLTWATELPFSDLAIIQTLAVLVIFTIDRAYTKLVMFMATYAGFMWFVQDNVYGLVFSCFVFGVVLGRVIKWRHYHQVKKS